ncbi:hypothetical protein ACFO25_00015 [Paenactinomyces guangxiensis]|uniref:Uncharacterized protein n=1 Tax=Paenactinomyces guangxiensis TaxID=1490290 RepID=A0A7W1WSK3_9BACL|nr:hypothetical protein [Paenactinomyces guangxiensis]MBA4495293.1 hypothetical protein [Paenactinomyces guangxiensis]MBH8592378.1 hypothetical protein [Paenactinomyces guangxiensis]
MVIGELELVRVFSGEEYRNDIEDEKWIVATVFETHDIRGRAKTNARMQHPVRFFDLSKLPENIDLRFQDYIKAYLTRTLPSVCSMNILCEK